MQKERLLQTMSACVENGQRLYQDAELLGLDRSPTAIALCILAQEEFAKAFLLHLVYEGIIPWTANVGKSLKNHKHKQLVGIIMEWLSPTDEEYIARMGKCSEDVTLPTHVADAMKLYVEKVLPQGQACCPLAENDPIAKRVGDRDKAKQDALYVRLSKAGEIISVPSSVTSEMVDAELEKTKRLSDLVRPLREGPLGLIRDFHLLEETMKFLLLDKRNRPFLLLKLSKFNGPETSLSGTRWLHSITVLIENISAEQAMGVSGHAAVFVDEEPVEPLFRIDQFMVDPHTTMICTFGVSEETFEFRTSSARKLVLYVNFKYHGILSDRKYHVRMWSRYDPIVGIFRETLLDAQGSVNGESESLVETNIWWNRPTTG
ncbi:MAG: AbiV family abortive infection protein [Nitrospirales bacterium]|nr:AbiV family abortive infection protein [Nitrospirales bacterium]